MSTFKRTISLMLTLAMMLSILPPAAVRAEEIEETAAVETIAAETAAPTEALALPETTVSAEAAELTEATVPTEAAELIETTAPAEETQEPETTEAPEETAAPENTEAAEVPEETGEETAEIGGVCGDDLTWSLEEGILTVSGTGDMADFDPEASRAPWYAYRTEFTEVVIGEGVTSLGAYSFDGCADVLQVTFLGDCPNIAETAFGGVTADIYYPEGNSTWEELPTGGFGGNLTWIPFEQAVGATAQSLSVQTMPSKTWYSVGESISLTGLVLRQRNSDGTTQTISSGIRLVSGSTSTTGRKTVTVGVGSLTTSFEIIVHRTQSGEVLQPSSGYPQSPHNYTNNFTQTYTYSVTGAQYLKLTFSSSTYTENNYDYIYIYNGSGSQIGKYCGSTLANKTIQVTGDTVKIKLTTDVSNTYYGFSLSSIYAYISTQPIHEYTPTHNFVDCLTPGSTTNSCFCGEYYEEEDEIAPGHNYVSGSCTACGKVQPTPLTVQTMPSKTWYLVGESIDLSGLQLRLTDEWEDVTTLTPSSSGVTLVSGSTSSVGRKTVVIGYGDLRTSFEIVVHQGITSEVLQPSSGYPQSPHNYSNNFNQTYTYRVPGAEYLKLTFSSSTQTESGWDYIYIYDGNGTQQGNSYSGTSLANRTIQVSGDTVKIKLTSDSSNVYYGFSLSSIYASIPNDYEHTYRNGICIACGEAELVAISVTRNPTKTSYLVGESLNSSGLEVQAEYADGTTETLSTSDLTLSSNGTFSTVGVIPVEVRYEDVSTTFNVFVHAADMGEVLQPRSGYPESAHNYTNSMDRYYTYSVTGASYLKLTFSTSTEVESSYDKIYIYNGSGTLLNTYTGTQLAGQTIQVTGSTVKIRLTSDGSVTKYGFSLTSIYASVPSVPRHQYESVHTPGACLGYGSTTYTCFCGDQYTEQDSQRTPHSYSNNVCSVCGNERPTPLTVETMPNKTSYEIGETIDLSGLRLRYTNEWEEASIINYSSGSISLVSGSTSEAGRQTVVVGYNSLTVSFEIVVHRRNWNIELQPSSGYPESPHDYSDNFNQTYTYRVPGAAYLELTFSDSTRTESGYDYIYIYDGSNNCIGTYDGTELAGQTVRVEGDTVKIKLTTDVSRVYYGFSLTSIYAAIPGDLIHEYDSGVYTAPNCISDGYTTYTCQVCGTTRVEQDYNTMTGIHTYASVYTQPGCYSDGYTTHTCQVCSHQEVEQDVGSAGHAYVNGICSSCGADQIVSATLYTMPDKSAYGVGETIDLTGLQLQVTYLNGTTEILDYTQGIALLSGSTAEAGRPTLTVGNRDVSVEFEIVVHEKETGEVLQPSRDYPESDHNYSDNMDRTYSYSVPDAQYLRVTFSGSTSLENNWDKIYIYDGAGNQEGIYTGTELAGRTIQVSGDTIRIRMTTDGSVTRYGFSITSIYASMDRVIHEPDGDGIYTPPGCVEDGYTTHTCWICGENYDIQDVGSAHHRYSGGVCSSCGVPENTIENGTTGSAQWAMTFDGVLYVYGNGPMANYSSGSAPWNGFRDQITALVIGGNVTTIGEYAFDSCTKVKSVTIGRRVTSIGRYAFRDCDLITSLVIPDSVTYIGYAAFDWCDSLASVVVGKNVATVDTYAFSGCKKLKQISFRGAAPTFGSLVFNEVTATAIYPGNQAGWTSSVRQDYGGKITWKTVNLSKLLILDASGADVTGTTQWVYLNFGQEPVTFGYAGQPVGANDDCTWSWSGGPAAVEVNEDGTVTVIPSGMTGQMTLTATADSDNKIQAAVTIQFAVLEPEKEEIPGEDPADMNLLSGKSKQLKIIDIHTGKALTAKQVTWSMDEMYAPYAKVDAKGKVTAKKVVEKSRVEVVAHIVGKEYATVTTVIDVFPAVSAVQLTDGYAAVNNRTLSLDYGETSLTLNADLYPLDAMDGVTWTISDKKSAFASYEIADDVLTICNPTGKAGTVTIKAVSKDGSNKSASVKVQFAAYAQSVDIDRSVTELTGGSSIQLSATVWPSVVTKPGIVWSLKNPSDKSYASVAANGKLTAKAVLAPVDVTVVATSKDGMASDEHTVRILPKSEAQLVIKAGNTYVTKTTQTLDVNSRQSITLKAYTYGQSNSTYVEWSPLESKYADIRVNSDGSMTIRMNEAGTVNVTAKAADGRKATVTVKGVQMATAVYLSQKKTNRTSGLEVASGKSLELQADVHNAKNKKVTWSIVQGSQFATVSTSGKVTALKDLISGGRVVVRAVAEGGASAEIEIMVRPLAQGVQVYSSAGGHMLFSFRTQQWWVRSNTTLTWDLSTQPNIIALDAHVFPYYGEEDSKNAMQSVIGKTSSSKVAKMEPTADGKVQLRLLKTGTSTITVTAADGSGQKVSFKLNVIKSVTDLSLGNQTVASGKSINLAKLVTINPSDATNKKLNWSIVSGGAYATISNGTLKAKKVTSRKTVTVKVASQDGGAETTCVVTINP